MSFEVLRAQLPPSSFCLTSFRNYLILSSLIFSSRYFSLRIMSFFSSSLRLSISSISTALIFYCQFFYPSFLCSYSCFTSASMLEIISQEMRLSFCFLFLAFYLFIASFCSMSLRVSCLVTQVSCVLMSTRSEEIISYSKFFDSFLKRAHQPTTFFIFSPYSSSLRTTLSALFCNFCMLRCPYFSSSKVLSSPLRFLISSSLSRIVSLLQTHQSCLLAINILFFRSAIQICCFCTSRRFSRMSQSSSSMRLSPIPQFFFLDLSFWRISSSCFASSYI